MSKVVTGNAKLFARIAELEAENQRLKQSLKARLSDHINGTPCAEIRWLHEKAELEDENKRLRELLKQVIDYDWCVPDEVEDEIRMLLKEGNGNANDEI